MLDELKATDPTIGTNADWKTAAKTKWTELNKDIGWNNDRVDLKKLKSLKKHMKRNCASSKKESAEIKEITDIIHEAGKLPWLLSISVIFMTN